MKSVNDSLSARLDAMGLAVSTLAPCRLPSESVKTSRQRAQDGRHMETASLRWNDLLTSNPNPG